MNTRTAYKFCCKRQSGTSAHISSSKHHVVHHVVSAALPVEMRLVPACSLGSTWLSIVVRSTRFASDASQCFCTIRLRVMHPFILAHTQACPPKCVLRQITLRLHAHICTVSQQKAGKSPSISLPAFLVIHQVSDTFAGCSMACGRRFWNT